jgi:hypothetical protein
VCKGRGRVEERSKGAAREIEANQQDRRTDLEVCKAWLFVVLYFPQVGHYHRTGAQINNNKHHSNSFPFGVLPKNFMCNVFGFQFLLPL